MPESKIPPLPLGPSRGRWFLLRAFIPTWRFFDRIEHTPQLFTRWRPHSPQDSNNSYGPWQELSLTSPRPVRAILFNPIGNLEFAYHSLLERALSDLEDWPADKPADAFAATVSYRLVTRLVAQLLTSQQSPRLEASPTSQLCFQFKITVLHAGIPTFSEDLLISQEHVLANESER